jgi:Zn-finger nucleic acid-binding protein
MNCPIDGKKLEAGFIVNRGEHKCSECGGHFVGLDGFASSRLSSSKLNPQAKEKIELNEEHQRMSPATGKLMMLIKYRGVFIDYCEESNSIWLDQGEIEKIIEREEQKKKPKKSLTSQVTDGLDAGISANLDSIIDAIISAW